MIRIIKSIIKLVLAPLSWFLAIVKDDRFVIRSPAVIQFVGPPGSGKTMGAVALLYRTSKKYPNMAKYATEDAGCMIAKKINTQDLAKYKFTYSLILIDESSLNGLDSREWNSNFKGDKKNILRQLKLHRHYRNSFITTSQSVNDNDSKLRDGLVKKTYICKNGIFFVAVERAIIWYQFDNGNYRLMVEYPSLFEKITDPYASFHLFKKKYGRLYNTHATVPEIDNLPDIRSRG